MFWSEIAEGGWSPWHAPGATLVRGFLKKCLSQMKRDGWGGEGKSVGE